MMHMLETNFLSTDSSAAASFSIRNLQHLPIENCSVAKAFGNVLKPSSPTHYLIFEDRLDP